MTVNDLAFPEDVGLSPQFIHRAIQGTEHSVVFEKRYRHRQDHILYSQVASSLVHNSQGQPLYFISQVEDLTERKRAEEALRESDIQFKKLSSQVPGMIYQFMKRLDGTYCVPFTTEAIKDIFGCSPQDVREDFSPITRVILSEDLDKLIC